jgi:hypothetical protein
VLLAIWGDVGDHMRLLLEGYSLADLAAITQGNRSWPGQPSS